MGQAIWNLGGKTISKWIYLKKAIVQPEDGGNLSLQELLTEVNSLFSKYKLVEVKSNDIEKPAIVLCCVLHLWWNVMNLNNTIDLSFS